MYAMPIFVLIDRLTLRSDDDLEIPLRSMIASMSDNWEKGKSEVLSTRVWGG